MSPRRRSPASVAQAISEHFSGDQDRPSFLRGLTLGALVGAAIAGSTLWNRWRHRDPTLPSVAPKLPPPEV
jgi:hypothetical protein